MPQLECKHPSLVIASLFRTRAELVDPYRQRVEKLHWSGSTRVVLVEGDSTDRTAAKLDAWAAESPNVKVIHLNHGRPYYGSGVSAERFQNLTMVANVGLEAALEFQPDFIMLLESDISYEPTLAEQLHSAIEHLPDAGIVAPHVWFEAEDKRERFYDSWAFRLPRTGPFESHPDDLREVLEARLPKLPYKLDSGGTVLFCRSEVIRAGARLRNESVIVGFCDSARTLGFEIYADPRVNVTHPKDHGPPAEDVEER